MANARLMSNPIQEDYYQSVVNEHIYHMLEPPDQVVANVDGTVYDSLCKLDVMLPNGQMVPATLVRNASGRVIPLVEVNSQTLPHHNSSQQSPVMLQQQQPQASVAASVNNKNRILMTSSSAASSSSPRSSNNRHFV